MASTSIKKTIVRRSLPEHNPLSAHDLPPLLQRVYITRGVQSVTELERGLDQLLPYQNLLGIKQATQYLADAVTQQKRLLVIGDFDADGATSTAVAISALKLFGAKHAQFLVPNRFEYGYGLTPEIVAVAKDLQPDVIITVDNGIANHDGVAAAKALGIQVIITDHHLPGHDLPIADAIVNPQQPGDNFASKNLAGVGVIFYVMLALRSKLRELNWFAAQNIPDPNMAQLLDLVALGTVADLVPLDRNNRILVYQGVQRIRAGKARPGINALLAVAGRAHERLVAADLGFAVAPRLNAAGRLTDMAVGIECLLSTDHNAARKIAVQLNALNDERRLIEREMQAQAFTELKKLRQLDEQIDKLPLGVCLFDENWHQGVIGLLASRVKDHVHRPTIIFAVSNDQELKGSARSINGLHIRDVLAAINAKHPQVIKRFGGHAMAAGLTLMREHYKTFCQVFDDEVREQIDHNKLQGEIYSDGELGPREFCLEIAEQLREAGPWGQTFPEPIFEGKFKLVQQWLVGGKHLKLSLGVESLSQVLDAIAFNVDLEQWPNHRLEYIYAAYRLDVNEYQGRKSVQLIVEQMEPA
jgi:single-stranded-DNA-specific exonuclease